MNDHSFGIYHHQIRNKAVLMLFEQWIATRQYRSPKQILHNSTMQINVCECAMIVHVFVCVFVFNELYELLAACVHFVQCSMLISFNSK